MPVIPFGVGSSLEGPSAGGAGRRQHRPVAHEQGARGQRRGPDGDGAGRRDAHAAQRRDPAHRPVLPDRPGRRRLASAACARRAPAAPTRCATARCARTCSASTVVTAQRRGDPHRHAGAQVVGRLRPDAADGRQRRHARRDDRDHAARLSAARGDVGRDLHLPERSTPRCARRSRSSRWASRSRAASCSTATRCSAVNRHDKLSLTEAPMLLMEFHGSAAGVAEQAATVQEIASEHGGEGFQWATTPEERTKLWTARHHAYFAGLQMKPGCRTVTTDTCVPISRLAESRDSTRVGGGRRRAACRTTSSATSATATSTSPTWSTRTCPRSARPPSGSTTRWCMRALALDGTCSGEHGIGLHKMDFLVDRGRRRRDRHDAHDQARARPEEHHEPGEDLRALARTLSPALARDGVATRLSRSLGGRGRPRWGR